MKWICSADLFGEQWGAQAFKNMLIVPPGSGIVHQVNLEYLARVVFADENSVLYPDSVVGTDSHTTMINGLGVLGWGVGGIEAEAVMLGICLYFLFHSPPTPLTLFRYSNGIECGF